MKTTSKRFRLWPFALAGALLLTACGGTSEDSDSVKIDGVNLSETINKSTFYDVTINGAGNKVTIKTANNVNHLHVGGSENSVWIAPNTSVRSIRMEGEDNTIHVPVGFKSNITKDGRNNVIREGW